MTLALSIMVLLPQHYTRRSERLILIQAALTLVLLVRQLALPQPGAIAILLFVKIQPISPLALVVIVSAYLQALDGIRIALLLAVKKLCAWEHASHSLSSFRRQVVMFL